MFFIPVYILILFFTIIVDYFAGILIENADYKTKKKYLFLSVFANIGVLATFKYYNFLNDNLSEMFSWLGHSNPIPHLDIILPIGLSFHTFQALSYTIEVYRGNQKAERHLGIYALYVMFFPQLVAGPIERPQNLLHQFREKHYFNYGNVTNGLKLIAWGLFKKIVIADRLSIIVDEVYDHPANHFGWVTIIATIFFSFQIYCDFSGYSDIAIGSAQVMGFKLMTNFNRPYFSKSIAEFWKRWHISLSTWFKDYLYVPLGGNRVLKWRWYYNLFITFMISGLWHGANWTFIIWGALHGFYLVFALATQNSRDGLNKKIGFYKGSVLLKWVQCASVFILVTFAWIFFRAKNINDAFIIIKNSFKLNSEKINESVFGFSLNQLYYGFFFIGLLLTIEWLMRGKKVREYISEKPLVIRWSIYVVLILFILNFGIFGNNTFIYFQF